MRTPIAMLMLLLLPSPFSIAEGTLIEAIDRLPSCAVRMSVLMRYNALILT